MWLEERKEASEEGCRGKRGTGKEEGEGEGGLVRTDVKWRTPVPESRRGRDRETTKGSSL